MPRQFGEEGLMGNIVQIWNLALYDRHTLNRRKGTYLAVE